MRLLLTVFCKEFVENLRDRRTVFAALVMGPLFAPLLFGVMMNFMVKQGVREPDKPLDIALLNGAAAPRLRERCAACALLIAASIRTLEVSSSDTRRALTSPVSISPRL